MLAFTHYLNLLLMFCFELFCVDIGFVYDHNMYELIEHRIKRRNGADNYFRKWEQMPFTGVAKS